MKNSNTLLGIATVLFLLPVAIIVWAIAITLIAKLIGGLL